MPGLKPTSEEGEDTHERLLNAAEALFAERGFDGASVRDIVAQANVNLAAVNYHFGSKSALLMEAFGRRARELNRERAARLRAAEPDLTLEKILSAFIAPPILWRDPAAGKATASRFIMRALAEVTPDLRRVLESDVSHLSIFVAALERVLPDWPQAEACWALHFAGGVVHQCTDTMFKRLDALSGGACDSADVEGIVERAVRFAVAGVEAMRPNG